MTPRKLIFYWTLYSLTALFLVLLQSAALNHLYFHGAHPFFLPCIAGITAVYTPRKGGVVFAFFLGFVCDMLFTGAIPCFYLLTFTLCAVGSGFLSHRFIAPGFFCSLLVGGLSVFFTELLQMFFLSFRGNIPFFPGMTLLLTELAITLPFLLLLHPLYARLDRFLANV